MKTHFITPLSANGWRLLVIILLSAKVCAQVGDGPPENSPKVTATEVLVQEALANNPELAFYEAELQAAQASRRAAAKMPNPELSASAGQKRIRESAGGLAAEGVAWSVSIMQPFEWPGRVGLRKAIANYDIELAQIGLKQFQHALAGRVRLLAFELSAAREKAIAIREVADRFQALREVLVQRDSTGLTPMLETRVIEATELTTKRRAAAAEVAIQTATLELNQLLGHPLESDLIPATMPLTFTSPPPMAGLIALARTNNFELRLRETELAQQGFKVSLARNEQYPSITAGPVFSEENAGGRERIIGVGISFPLPFWNRNTGAIETAKARQIQAAASLETARREVDRRVAEAAFTYQMRLKEMNQWQPDAISHFQTAAALADRHYRLGAVPVSTYVELQKQYLDAVEALLDTRNEALKAAQNLFLLAAVPLPLVTSETRNDVKANPSLKTP